MSKSVLVLEDDLDLGELLKELFLSHGTGVTLVDSVRSLVEKRAEVLACAVCLLDIELGKDKPNGIDAFTWLRSQNYSGRIYFLTGHGREHPSVRRASLIGSAGVLSKPAAPEVLLNLVRECSV